MEQMPYVPQQVVVSHILPRLPFRSLLRCIGVCRAWRDAITHDGSFCRVHLRLQKPALLLAPRTKSTAGLYQLDACTQDTAAALVHDHSFSRAMELGGVLAHCDGLLLLSDGPNKLRVLNPATRRFLTLPWSTHGLKADLSAHGHHYGDQALGLGHDPGSDKYKVARFFHRPVEHLQGGRYQYNIGVEVFTIGAQHRWRETATQPPYPVMPTQTATFFKGSLIWTIEESFRGVAPGFLLFSLEDESFSVMPPPPSWRPRLDYEASSLAELRGELCLCVPPNWKDLEYDLEYGSMDIWFCNDLGTGGAHTRWERRYVLANVPRFLRVIGSFDDEEMVFQEEKYRLRFYKQPHGVLKNVVSIQDLKFHDPEDGTTVKYTREVLHGCHAISYLPSLVPL
jgi:F-box interacting protein